MTTVLSQDINSSKLTNREREILFLIANEFTSDMIACKLFISTHTVISHRKNLLEKLDVKNVAGLIRRAFEVQILKASD